MKKIWGYTRVSLVMMMLGPWFILVLPLVAGGRLILGPGPKIRRYGFNTLAWTCRVLLEWGLGAKTTVSGAENIPQDSGCLFMSNHQAFSDILLGYGYINRPMAFVAKKELVWFFPANVWMYAIECYLIDRKNPRQSIPLFERASRNMQEGYATMIYPEGTRSHGPENKDFMVGAMRLAYQSKCPVIPVTISGSWKANAMIAGTCKDKRFHITIHPPINPIDYPANQKQLLANAVQKAVESGYTVENER